MWIIEFPTNACNERKGEMKKKIIKNFALICLWFFRYDHLELYYLLMEQ